MILVVFYNALPLKDVGTRAQTYHLDGLPAQTESWQGRFHGSPGDQAPCTESIVLRSGVQRPASSSHLG